MTSKKGAEGNHVGQKIMYPDELAQKCEELMPYWKRGQFYGPANEMGLGSGIVVTNVAQPVYLPDIDAFGTGRGAALILTHECDIDPNNIRPFSDKAIVAPLIKLDKYLENFNADSNNADAISFATNVAKGNTTRLHFLPRFGDNQSPLHLGAFIDFNYITSCGIQSLANSPILCSLSRYAISIIDRALANHLFRPKADVPPPPG